MSVAAAMRLGMPHGCNKLCVGSLEDLVPFVLLMILTIYYVVRLVVSGMRESKNKLGTVGRQNVGTRSRGALTASGLGH